MDWTIQDIYPHTATLSYLQTCPGNCAQSDSDFAMPPVMIITTEWLLPSAQLSQTVISERVVMPLASL